GPKRHRVGQRQAAFACSDQCVPRAYTCRTNSNQGFLLSRLRQIDIFDDDYVWWPWLVDSRCAHASISPIAPQSRRLPVQLGSTTPSLPASRSLQRPQGSPPGTRSAGEGTFSIVRDQPSLSAAAVMTSP